MARDPFRSEDHIDFDGSNIGEFLLDVLTKGLYSRPDLIIREYIQNGHDAICSWNNNTEKGRIDITISRPNIHIFDNGPGMDRQELLRAMSNIGKSFKNISASSGFMGIGKLAGLSMASRVEIHSSKHGSPEKNWVVFNSSEMLAQIMERRRTGEDRSILQTLNEHTLSNKLPIYEDSDKHYTSVHLMDIDEEYRDKLENLESFVHSIGLIVPVVQHPSFKYATQIHELLSDTIPEQYKPIDIYINGEPVYRPYVQGLGRPQELHIIGEEGNTLAYGWASLYTASERNRRRIPNPDLRGIQLMQRGIAVGQRDLPEQMEIYSSTSELIYFRWYCGELYITDPRIVLSADRSRIRQNQHTTEFIARASEVFKMLSKKAEKFSQRDNAQIMVAESAHKVVNIEQQIRSESITQDRVKRIVTELGQAQSEIEKRKDYIGGTPAEQQAEETEKKINAILELLTGAQIKTKESDDNTLPLSQLIECENEQDNSHEDIEATSEITIIDIPGKLQFSAREAQIYRLTIDAVAEACGGKDKEEFVRVLLVVETALQNVFGNKNTEEE